MAETIRKRYAIKVVTGKYDNTPPNEVTSETVDVPVSSPVVKYVRLIVDINAAAEHEKTKKIVKSSSYAVAFQNFYGSSYDRLYFRDFRGAYDYICYANNFSANSFYKRRFYENNYNPNNDTIADVWIEDKSSSASAKMYTHKSALFSPYIEDTLEDIKLIPENLVPSSFIDAVNSANFEWGYQIDTRAEDGKQRTQKSAVIQWTSDSVSINTVNVSGTESAYVFPANTFPKNSSFKWRVKIVSDDDVEGDFSDWVTVSTTDVAGTVRALSPDNAVVNADIDNRFSWIYSNPYGTEPTGYEIEMSSNGGLSWQQIKKASTSERFADIPAGTLPAGNIQYRVRAFSQSGIASEWAVANLTVRARPAAPSIYRVDTDIDRPTVYWESVDQEAYELEIFDDSGKAIYSHYAALPDRSHKIAKRLDNEQYTASLMIWNGFGLESPKTQSRFVLSAAKPPKPSISGTALAKYNSLSLSNTTQRAVLLRDGIAIAEVGGLSSYEDYTAPISCEYRLRALSDTAFCDSDPLRLTYERAGKAAAMSLAKDHDVTVSFIYKQGSLPERTSSLSADCTLLQFAGRKRPVAEYGDQLLRTKSLSYSLINQSDIEIIRSMVGQTVVWNDRQDHMVACLSNLSWSARRGYIDVSFTLTEIDNYEGIDYE